ncbi:MAG TPA: hypothetical protein PLT50_01855 [bacterium]|nr:hypothetical protein [bacterium]
MDSQKPYNIEPHIESTLCYLPFLGIVVLLTEKENRNTRFHAFQSIFFWICAIAVASIIQTLKFLIIGIFLAPIFNIGITGLWFYMMWKTYNKERVELPVIGKLAKEQAEKGESAPKNNFEN